MDTQQVQAELKGLRIRMQNAGLTTVFANATIMPDEIVISYGGSARPSWFYADTVTVQTTDRGYDFGATLLAIRIQIDGWAERIKAASGA